MASDLGELLIAWANRPLPTEINATLLAATPDDVVANLVCDFVIGKVKNRMSEEADIVASLPIGIQNLYITSSVHFEVLNGGFNQFYFNSSRKFALVAPRAYEYFGAHVLADIVRAANSQRSTEGRAVRAITRLRTMAAFMESYRHSKLKPFDARYAELQGTLEPLWVARIRAASEDFLSE